MTLLWRKIQLTLLLTILLTFQILGQLKMEEVSAPQSDVKIWTGVFMNQSIAENLDATIKMSYYTRSNLYSPRFSDVGLRYNFHKKMSVGAFYRFSKYFKTDERRMYLELTDKLPILASGKGIIIQPRLRWQQKINPINNLKEQHIRPRIVIKSKMLDIPIQPFIAAEAFFCYEPVIVDKYRITSGFDYALNENYTLRFFFRHQKERLIAKNEIDKHNTFNLSYRFKF